MPLRVYTYKSCDTCRRAIKWLDARGVAHEVLPIREQPPTKAELKTMLAHVGGALRKLFNTSGQDYKALGLKDRLPTMTEAEALALLSSNGNLVKRPFALGDGTGTVGFDEGDWAQRFGTAEGSGPSRRAK